MDDATNAPAAVPAGGVRPGRPRIEHHVEPLGIGESRPRVTWPVLDAPDGWSQTAYELRVRRAGGEQVPSGWIESADQVLVAWPFDPLTSRERAEIAVRVRGTVGDASPWSPIAPLEAGLLTPGDWVAQAIAADLVEPDTDLRRPPVLRHSFRIDRPIVAARLYLTAHGLVEAYLNGQRVGDDVLAPGWTVYPERLVYRTHDVSDLVREGDNAIGALLGDGWYRGRLGFDGGRRDIYGDRLALLAQLEVEHPDGSRTVVATGPGWTAGDGPVLRSGLYEGESHDERLNPGGWSEPGFDDSGWVGVTGIERDPGTLVAPDGPPIRCTQEVRPVTVGRTSRGTHLLDFGQNLVGRLRIRPNGPEGTRIVLRHAEVLQDGELCVRPLRAATSVDEYVLGSQGRQTWEPRFTIHGFRYAEIEGWRGDLHDGDVVARVLHTDMRRTGGFASSDERLDRLHENVVWSMRGNFVGLPTDCPQRDERLGWTGDIQVFAPTATYLYDTAGLLSSWLRDLSSEQLPDGTVPWYVPNIYGNPMWSPARPGAAWGDAAAIVPWVLYQHYGDRTILERQYPSATAWVDRVSALAGPDRVWDEGFQLGDWLDPAAPPDDPGAGRTDRYLVATAYFARSSRLVSRMARVLGHDGDAERYGRLADEIVHAFVDRYVQRDGRLTSDAPTAYALALEFDLLLPESRTAAGDRLAELVRQEGDRIATGFVGTPLILHALTSTGHLDRAYALLMQSQSPSWLSMVDRGATTIWERWDSMLPDGTVNPGDMTSFNHYALGAVADWLHGTVAGLVQASPTGSELVVAPRPGGGLTWASTWLETPLGRASVRWDLEGDELAVTVEVPHGARASIDLGDRRSVVVGPGRHVLRRAA